MARGARLLRTAAAYKPPFSSPKLIRPELHVDDFLRRADRVRPAPPAMPGHRARALASHIFMREYALLQRVFLELDDRLGASFAPASLLVADLPGSQAAALLAAHDKWGGPDGSLTHLASPDLDGLTAFRELCPERAVTLASESGSEQRFSGASGRRYDLICAAFDAHHSAAGQGGGSAGSGSHLAETVLSLSRLLNPDGVLVLVEPLGAEHLGELYLTPTLVPAVRRLATELIAQGAPLSVVAPCMHSLACPLLAQPNAFHSKRTRHCTFAQRYERRRTQRLGGMRASLNYGNTHFAYLCLTAPAHARAAPRGRETDASSHKGGGGSGTSGEGASRAVPTHVAGRILTPPRKRAGHVMLDLCTSSGELLSLTVSKRKHGSGGSALAPDAAAASDDEDGADGAPLSPYRAARVSSWGDPWEGPAGP